ncbi:NAD(P)-binding protein [Rozella allomycis CSF55]|uniref:NAD(P)-binding protein n=1 Tax=Rozella allomycis (strain CSF55) TaxID=988480 RepID=A0A4V1J0B7_ROZAC|nr:NAD(P)-binding protein [Rozella allomycis CSF55]
MIFPKNQLCGRNKVWPVRISKKLKYCQLWYTKKGYWASLEISVKLFIEVSTGQVYDPDKKPSKENSKLKPWTFIARYKLQVENLLEQTENLPWIILRPAIIYGPGDLTGISNTLSLNTKVPRLTCGAVYKELKQKMEFLWTKDLKINTVHVNDVARAIFHVIHNGKRNEIYNLVDHANTDQENVNSCIRDIFKIETGFHGSLISNMAKLSLTSVVDEANDKHMKPWSTILTRADISYSPITPYLDKELLSNNSLCLDGTKIEQTGFEYEKNTLSRELILESLQYFVDQNLFPDYLIK